MNRVTQPAMNGWQGAILTVNLSSGSISTMDSREYVYQYMGGRGVATRLAWDLVPSPADPFHEDSPLILMTGPLTGTAAPFSGRTTVCGLAPQGWPVPWFTRSSFGGHFGPALKYAGFDGIVITGISPDAVYLLIEDGTIQLRRAACHWGKGIYQTQQDLMAVHGRDCRILAVGPAGENLCRIAVMATETESASGQGGFGAVMAGKKLKALVVRGSGAIRIADPKRFSSFCRLLANEAHGSHGWPRTRPLNRDLVEKYGQRYHACTQQCQVQCWDARYYRNVPAVVGKGLHSGQVDCIAQLFPGPKGTFYDWNIGFEAGFEVGRYANDFGLNHWELLVGIIPWLRRCHQEGMLRDFDGMAFDLSDPVIWHRLLRKIAYREGIGDALAEGGVRAAGILGFGQEFIGEFYPAWGYAGHWDGHGDHINFIYFPYWLVSALQWATDTRDPISSGHGYVQNVMGWSKSCSPVEGLKWDIIESLGERVYGSRDAFSPGSGYNAKAYPAVWHQHRSVIKDSLTVGDQIYPRIFSLHTDDHFARVIFEGRRIPGPSFEHEMYRLATGHDIGEGEFETICERVVNLDRCIQIRLFSRSRNHDEAVIPYFSAPENHINPLVGRPMSMKAESFRRVLDEYYHLRGWDPLTGRPEGRKLEELGIGWAG
ncbi:hypothetical protein JXA88_00360 [Candidatus Fermentibacteria bacterium]|nr:hypothetical protein [Candidatus Fermentibacteria bacterium]